LFFRLNVVAIHMPPLRERASDIPALLAHFLADAGAQAIMPDEDAMHALQSYKWPGNVRELRNFAERAAVFCDNEVLTREEAQRLLYSGSGGRPPEAAPDCGASGESTGFSLADLDQRYEEARYSFELAYFKRRLDKAGGVVAKAAEDAGMYSSNLHAKLKRLGLANYKPV
jgi:two-component system nitrogen regulation response regulator NtrX